MCRCELAGPDELEGTDTAAGEGAGVRGSPGTGCRPTGLRITREWRTRRRGGAFELKGAGELDGVEPFLRRKEKAGRRNLVNAEHRDEVAFSQAPPRRTISTSTLRMMERLYDRGAAVRIRFGETCQIVRCEIGT